MDMLHVELNLNSHTLGDVLQLKGHRQSFRLIVHQKARRRLLRLEVFSELCLGGITEENRTRLQETWRLPDFFLADDQGNF